MRHNPRRDPNFHQIDNFEGKGRSTNDPFSIRKIGCSFRNGPAIFYLYINDSIYVFSFYVDWGNFGFL